MSTPHSLKSFHGTFLCAEFGGGGKLVADRAVAGAWEQFTLVPSPYGGVGLRTVNGHFVCAEQGGGGVVVANRDALGPWETWLLVEDSPTSVGFRAWDKQHYLCAEVDGSVNATRAHKQTWETWAIDPALSVPPPPGPPPPKGRVQVEGRAFVDDRGPWNALGTSLFYAAAVGIPLQQVRDNMQWGRSGGVDYNRVFAECLDWLPPSTIDPRDPGWPARLRWVRDTAWEVGQRTQWTVFASNRTPPGWTSEAWQDRIVNEVLAVCQERPETVQFVEMCNEWFGYNERTNGYAARFVASGFPTAITSYGTTANPYVGSPANVATEHFDRDLWERGYRPVRQPWGYWERVASPPRFVNNEPVGILSSGQQDIDTTRLVMGAVTTWVSGGAAHCLHTGAGIYGVASVHPTAGLRPANLWEQTPFAPVLRGVAAMRALLPKALPTWKRENGHWPTHPFVYQPDSLGDIALANGRGLSRAYGMVKGADFVVAQLCLMQAVTFMPRAASTWTVYAPLTGQTLATGRGLEMMTLTEAEVGTGVVIIGHVT